jgi:hypothetical protein
MTSQRQVDDTHIRASKTRAGPPMTLDDIRPRRGALEASIAEQLQWPSPKGKSRPPETIPGQPRLASPPTGRRGPTRVASVVPAGSARQPNVRENHVTFQSGAERVASRCFAHATTPVTFALHNSLSNSRPRRAQVDAIKLLRCLTIGPDHGKLAAAKPKGPERPADSDSRVNAKRKSKLTSDRSSSPSATGLSFQDAFTCRSGPRPRTWLLQLPPTRAAPVPPNRGNSDSPRVRPRE